MVEIGVHFMNENKRANTVVLEKNEGRGEEQLEDSGHVPFDVRSTMRWAVQYYLRWRL